MQIIKKQEYQLLKEMVVADFKLRYQNSALGYVWSLARPLALFIILYIVFDKFMKIGGSIPHYPVYLLLGIVIWNFFLEATSMGLRSIVDRGDLIRKVSVSKYIIVATPIFSALINLILNFLIVITFAVISGIDFRMALLLTPFLLVELLILAVSVSFILSALYVTFRDIAYIWELVTQLLFYATPIIYPLTQVPSAASKFLLLSPIAQIIQDFRYALITPESITSSSILGDPLAFTPYIVVLLLGGISIYYFKASTPYFAEKI